MRPLSQLRLITFDVTDTLLQFKTSPGQQYGEIGALYGISCDKKVLGHNFKTHFRKMSQEHPNFGRHTGLGWEKWWHTVVKDSFKESDVNCDNEKLDQVATHLIDMYSGSGVWQVAHGAYGLLSFLRSKGVSLGVVSNYDPRLKNILINTRLRHYFQFVLISYHVGFEKPDPKIFLEAMSSAKLENLEPEECLHIGDQKSLDYDGARNCGWHAVLVNDKEKYPDIDKEHIFKSLFDIHKHFIKTSGESLSSHTV
uniref:Rhythmically expressed gene 2 protein n=1 Tax=Diabrotica virgifera virgifera TaxID=50390 RepID=A0A6P7GY51_DIAVI